MPINLVPGRPPPWSAKAAPLAFTTGRPNAAEPDRYGILTPTGEWLIPDLIRATQRFRQRRQSAGCGSGLLTALLRC